MFTPSPEQRALVDKLDDDTKHAVACTYRAKRRIGRSDGTARHAAVTVLEEHFPDIPYPYFDLSIAVGIIIDRATSEYGEEFWEGTSQGWKPLWMREVEAR